MVPTPSAYKSFKRLALVPQPCLEGCVWALVLAATEGVQPWPLKRKVFTQQDTSTVSAPRWQSMKQQLQGRGQDTAPAAKQTNPRCELKVWILWPCFSLEPQPSVSCLEDGVKWIPNHSREKWHCSHTGILCAEAFLFCEYCLSETSCDSALTLVQPYAIIPLVSIRD